MSDLIVSVSGIRGVVGQSLTPLVAMRFAAAFAADLPPGPVLVARDGRATGPMLADAVQSALCAMGRNVLQAEVASTPTAGIVIRERRAAGGMQISASHNPAEYNGLKLFSAAGRVLPAEAGQSVVSRYNAGTFAWVPHSQVGAVKSCPDPLQEHLALVVQAVNANQIRQRNFRVVVDANHGSGGELSRRLLTVLGCQVTILGESPDGQFEHTPEPTAENLQGVTQQAAQLKADIVFCQDPDADRLAIIDEAGRYLGEEYTLALCVDHRLRHRPGPIVTNGATSLMSADLAKKYGVPFSYSPVGEANVVDEMLAAGAVLGGEGNGGVIDPQIGLVRDSFLGMALVLDAMAARDLPVGRLADELPRYHIEKTKIPSGGLDVSQAISKLETLFPGAKIDRRDGLRLAWDNRWLLVRPSNTEPIVRAIAEAPDAATAQKLCAQAAAALR